MTPRRRPTPPRTPGSIRRTRPDAPPPPLHPLVRGRRRRLTDLPLLPFVAAATSSITWCSTGIDRRPPRRRVEGPLALSLQPLFPRQNLDFLFSVPILPGFTQFCAHVVILVLVRCLGVCRINMWWWMDYDRIGLLMAGLGSFACQSISSTRVKKTAAGAVFQTGKTGPVNRSNRPVNRKERFAMVY
jgi:hypothetical protein